MKATPVTYVIFDLLWLEGHSLIEEPYSARRERLDGLQLAGSSLQVPEYLVGHGRELLQAATEQGLEGVLAKRLASRYQPGRRTGDWLKIKRPGRQEFVVGGWLPGKGTRSRRIGALLLGRVRGRRLAALRRARRAAASASASWTAWPPCSSRWPRQLPLLRRPVPRAGRSSASRGWWPRCPSASGPRTGACATRSTSACARTRPAREVVREDAPVREPRAPATGARRRPAPRRTGDSWLPAGLESSTPAPALPSPTSKAAS